MRKLVNVLALTATLGCFVYSQPGLAQDKQAHKTVVLGGGAADFIPFSATSRSVGTESDVASPAVVRPQPDSPAPSLSKLYVQNVCTSSAGTGCETISSGQVATAITYTGSAVYAYVWEIGYGGNMTATQGGTSITGANVVAKTPICAVNGGYSVNCPSQFTIQGWRYIFDAGYYLNLNYAENFSATDTSVNSPYNRITANLQINYTH